MTQALHRATTKTVAPPAVRLAGSATLYGLAPAEAIRRGRVGAAVRAGVSR